jgi:tryptophanyl-tRNA synthetase
MSKSNSTKFSNIYLTTPPTEIQTLINRAVTDSIYDIYPDDSRPGITNLFSILSAMEKRPLNELVEEVRGYTPKMFKERVAESVIKGLSDVQRRYDEVKGDPEWIQSMRKQGNERAQKIARERMGKIREIIGFPTQQ